MSDGETIAESGALKGLSNSCAADRTMKTTPMYHAYRGPAAAFALLALAMRELPLGTSYMIWTGIGALGAFVVGVSFLGEPLSLQRTIAAALILSGLVTMKLSS